MVTCWGNNDYGQSVSSLSPASLPDGQVGVAYSQTISASGGTGPYSYTLASGSLPAGMSFTGGVLSGTPTTLGDYALAVLATDANAWTITQPYTLTVKSNELYLPILRR